LLMGGLARVIGVEWAIGSSAVITLLFSLWTAKVSKLVEL
jgi:hypothetical protein